jgi:hypothetical protein
MESCFAHCGQCDERVMWQHDWPENGLDYVEQPNLCCREVLEWELDVEAENVAKVDAKVRERGQKVGLSRPGRAVLASAPIAGSKRHTRRGSLASKYCAPSVAEK